MKNRLSSQLALLVACLLGSLCAAAAEGEKSGLTVAPMAGFYDFDGSRNFDDEGAVSLDIGWRFNDRWVVEAGYLRADTDDSVTRGDVDFYAWRLNGLYFINEQQVVRPFWIFGAGENVYDVKSANTDHENFVDYGIGFLYDFNESVALRTELRGVTEVDDSSSNDTDFILAMGLQFLFDFNKPTPAPAPAVAAPIAPQDSDNDGVVDTADQCPATPEGVAVDADGCALDDDNDGVPNYNDSCPDSEAGARVDGEGCYILLQEAREIKLNVQFPNNSSVIEKQFLSEIEAVSDFMREFPQTSAVIEGHTDDRGDANYNQQLSERRAQKVAKTLISTFNVDASRVSAVGYGEARPIADNGSGEGRAQNRRVVAVIKAMIEKRAE